MDLASKGVRVNAVNPGVIVTDIHKRSGLTEENYEKFLEHSKTTHALGRVGNVQEVANMISFLASEQASFITGEINLNTFHQNNKAILHYRPDYFYRRRARDYVSQINYKNENQKKT